MSTRIITDSNGRKHITNEPLLHQPAPVQEPVWIQPDHLQKAKTAPFLCRVEPHKRDDFVPLYTTPPAAQPAVPEGWQPIETAPKDFCTEFDGWNGKRVPEVSWAKPEFNQRGDYAWCIQQYESGYGWANVEVNGLTHWRPIPAAPEKGQP
jgi:hypothetical protein